MTKHEERIRNNNPTRRTRGGARNSSPHLRPRAPMYGPVAIIALVVALLHVVPFAAPSVAALDAAEAAGGGGGGGLGGTQGCPDGGCSEAGRDANATTADTIPSSAGDIADLADLADDGWYYGYDEHENCTEWVTSRPDECRTNRIQMFESCPESCNKIAGVSVDTLTDEEEMEDAIKGVVYVYTDEEEKEEGYDEWGDKKEGGDDDEEEDEERCKDRDDRCKEWKRSGDCVKRSELMADYCPHTCGVCFRTGVEVVKFGTEQEVNHPNPKIKDDIHRIIERTYTYMSERVYVEPQFSTVRGDCYNRDPKCSYYAAMGWCQETSGPDMKWMMEHCSPACRTCLQVEYWAWCAVESRATDVWEKAGDRNAMFERIVRDFPQYSPAVLSKPEGGGEKQRLLPPWTATSDDLLGVYSPRVLSRAEPTEEDDDEDPWEEGDDGDSSWDEHDDAFYENVPKPWVVTLDDFLSEEECDFLIAQGHRIGYERSGTLDEDLTDDYDEELDDDGEEQLEANDARTSRNTWCEDECIEHPIVRNIMERMVNLTGIPETNGENMQLLRYDVDQHYDMHHDSMSMWSSTSSGHRILTLFLYLNDVEEGGETRLNHLDLDVAPKRGKALLWPSVLDEDPDELDHWTFHEARPVTKGVKYGANVWFHLRDYKGAGDCVG